MNSEHVYAMFIVLEHQVVWMYKLLNVKNIYRWFASVFYHSLSKSSSILISVPEKNKISAQRLKKKGEKNTNEKRHEQSISTHIVCFTNIRMYKMKPASFVSLYCVRADVCTYAVSFSSVAFVVGVFFVIILSFAAASAAAAPSSAFCFRLMPCIAFCIYRKHQWTVVRISFHAEQAQRVESYHQITHSLFLLVYLSLSISVCLFFSCSIHTQDFGSYHFINICRQSWSELVIQSNEKQ